MKDIVTTAGSISFKVDGAIYTSDVLHKCLYWYSSQFDISIEERGNFQLLVSLISKTNDAISDELISKLKQDIVDFKLRDIVTKETSIIRELLIAKAFAHYEEEPPSTEVSDPVGFNPENI